MMEQKQYSRGSRVSHEGRETFDCLDVVRVYVQSTVGYRFYALTVTAEVGD